MLQAMHENAAVFRDGPTLQKAVKQVKEIWPEIMQGIKVGTSRVAWTGCLHLFHLNWLQKC